MWDEQLARAGAPVVRLRAEASERLDALARAHYAFIGGREDEVFRVGYKSQLLSPDPETAFLLALKKARQEDLRRMTTTVGPHRDDLMMTLSDKELRAFGSQGQIRTAALALKLAAFDLLTKAQEEPPLLLLDDVLSELDPSRRQRLIERIKGAQALLTCTDRGDFIGAKPACVLRVSEGQILEEPI